MQLGKELMQFPKNNIISIRVTVKSHVYKEVGSHPFWLIHNCTCLCLSDELYISAFSCSQMFKNKAQLWSFLQSWTHPSYFQGFEIVVLTSHLFSLCYSSTSAQFQMLISFRMRRKQGAYSSSPVIYLNYWILIANFPKSPLLRTLLSTINISGSLLRLLLKIQYR